MALTKQGIRAKFGLILEDQTVEREWGEEKREEEGEKKKKKKEEEKKKIKKVCFQLGIKCIFIS